MKHCVAEAVGTCTLVFAGTGAILADDASGGSVGLVRIAMAFGLVVMAVIYAIGGPMQHLAVYLAGPLLGAVPAGHLTNDLRGSGADRRNEQQA